MPTAKIVTTCRRMGEAGEMACFDECAMKGLHSIFSHHRVQPGETLPPPDPGICDIAVLDLHHGWPNLGHSSLVQAVREAACDFESTIRQAHLKVRVFSFDVRQFGLLPEPPGGRFHMYLGTGGPGHLDPRLNDGVAAFSQGVKEDPSWEPRLFRLFDAILADPEASLLAVCHSFGLLCRWSGVAEPVERGEDKGGKSAGVVECALTLDAQSHPWFRGMVHDAGSSRIRVIDSRLFDMVPTPSGFGTARPLSFEVLARDGSIGDALTGVEFARDQGGIMPRIIGVNHHPEIMAEGRQRLITETLWERREVTKAWYDERMNVVSQGSRDLATAQGLALTTGFNLVWPLRFHLVKDLRRRATRLNRTFEMDEDAIIEQRFTDRRTRVREPAPSPTEAFTTESWKERA